MHPGLLVGAGFLLGTVGVKAIKSEPAKKMLVQAAVSGMRVKEEAETLIDQAKAEFDDVIAQASYEKELACGTTIEAQADITEPSDSKPSPTANPTTEVPAAKPAVEAAANSAVDAAQAVKKVIASTNATNSKNTRGAGAGRGMGHGRGGK